MKPRLETLHFVSKRDEMYSIPLSLSRVNNLKIENESPTSSPRESAAL